MSVIDVPEFMNIVLELDEDKRYTNMILQHAKQKYPHKSDKILHQTISGCLISARDNNKPKLIRTEKHKGKKRYLYVIVI